MAAPAQFSTDHFALRLGLFYAAFFFFGGVQLPFFPVWLEARGLDARTIGLVIAVPMLVRIVATPLVAHQADARQALKATLVVAAVIGALGMTLVGLVEGAVAILLAYVVTMAACSPVLSLTDAYALNGLPPRGRAYGPVRLWGSVAFIAGNVGAGLILSVIAPGHLIWLIVGSLAVAVIAAIALVPLDRGQRPASIEPRASPLVLLRHPAFLAVALASSMVQGSHALYYGFSTLQWRALGFSGVTIGLLWGIGVAAEIVLFALSGRLPERLRPTTLLAIERRRRRHPLDCDGVRSADRAAPATATFARRFIRRGSPRRYGISRPRHSARTRSHGAGLCRYAFGHCSGVGNRTFRLALCQVRRPCLLTDGCHGVDWRCKRALRWTPLQRCRARHPLRSGEPQRCCCTPGTWRAARGRAGTPSSRTVRRAR